MAVPGLIASNFLVEGIWPTYVVSMTRVVVQTGGTDWLTPLATLLAVLVGGFVSWLVGLRLAMRQAQLGRAAEVEAAERLIDTQARAAARVLQSDLSAAASRLVSMVERGQWLSFFTLAPPSWGTGQVSLAKRLDQVAWVTVAEVAIQLRAIDDLMRAAVADGGPRAGASSVAISPENNERFESLRRDTTEAYNLLADVAETPRV